ncbi:MAG TPA: bifunctional YncE family protein/alkaline phosphatase family protein [Longimicrobium sp.]|nr:bifunctional YncE family protein/alkaline phosphatase family protein [Longimicrobium sp.]
MHRRVLALATASVALAACAPPSPAPAPAPPRTDSAAASPASAAPSSPPSPAPATAPAAAPVALRVSPDSLRPRLPTGVRLDPEGALTPIAPMPLAMLRAPGGDRVVMLTCGWQRQGLLVAGRDGRVLQALEQPAAFVGLAFSPDGRTLYASGGDQDVVYRYAWDGETAALRDSLVLAVRKPRSNGTRYPAGIGVSPDGRWLYVAENLADSLAMVDLRSGRVAARFATELYPYGVAVAPDGTVYVSAWGGSTVSVFTPRAAGIVPAGRITVGRHPSALLLSRDGRRLFAASGSTDRVAVVDTRTRRVTARLSDAPPAGPAEGSTPNALALSADGTRLYVAEGDANAVAIFDLSARTSGVAAARGADRLAGRVPAGWYPSAVLAIGDTLLVGNGKGLGTRANPDGPQPAATVMHGGTPRGNTTLRQIEGALQVSPVARATGAGLAALTARVIRANGWDRPHTRTAAYPPFTHVIYVIKENRTYDQVLGDLPEGDGDTTLLFFGPRSAPNHKALARRFGLFDRFFVNAEVSPDGHNWSTAAYTTDYLQKTVPSRYSGRGRSYDYEGTNRGWEVENIPDDDVNEPASGYLWDLARRRGITFRNYGEFVVDEKENGRTVRYRGTKPFLVPNTSPDFPGFGLAISDQHRADVWLAEFRGHVRTGRMPALEIVRLPNDHTSGARAGMPTPRAAFADNDLALARMVEALSRSPFWRNTVMFVLEDDAQNGADHVDSHRSPLLVISAYNRPGVIHRFANTTDVIRTMEEILGLASLSHFDGFGRPLRDIWAAEPDLTPYTALIPEQRLDELNPANTALARASARLDLRQEDVADEVLFNQILWEAIKGPGVPYPGTTRMPAREMMGGGR